MAEELIENGDLLWDKVKENLKKELREQTYETWIHPVTFQSVDNETITLIVPDSFHASWLRDRYHDLISSSFSILLGKRPSITFSVSSLHGTTKESTTETTPEGPLNIEHTPLPQKKETPYIKLEEQTEEKYTFDTFVVGASSRFAHAAAIAVSEAPAKRYNPLFIYGPVGLGKTHLLQAIAYEAKKNNRATKTLYISSEKFTNQLITAIQKRATIEFRKKFRQVDILLIDDIHFLANKDATQEEFFHTFNELYDNQKQIILTSDRPPKDIPGLEDRLVSRFEWGLVTDIQPPEFETRVAILKKKMERETVTVPDDVLYFIASKIKSNIRELEGALIRVVAYSSLIGHAITLDLTKNVLKDSLSEEEKKITIPFVQQKTADYFGIKVSDMRTKKRNKSISYPRQIAMYLVRSLTEHSLPEIGEYFGGRDHTTVLHAISKIEKEMNTQEKTKKTIDDIISVIKC